MPRILVCFSLFFIVASLTAAAGSDGTFSFPPTAKGERIAAYFAAFNAPQEEAMAAFLNEHLSSESLRRDPLEQRLMRFRGLKHNSRTLTPEKILSVAEETIRVLARDGQGQWLEMEFSFATEKTGKITAIRGAPVDPKDLTDLSGPPLSREELLARVRTFVEEESKAGRFSGVVLIAEKDQPAFHQACGLASVEYGIANTPDTLFNLGSINKLFTRVAIGQLIEKGRLSLDDKVDKFLPTYPNREAAQQITVRQLLDMTSGIGDFFGAAYAATPKDRIRLLEDYLPLFAAAPLQFTPGSNRTYSNGGYVVLGLIVAAASDQSYYDYVQQHIYQPAGMTATAHLDADMPTANVASGYTRLWDGRNHENEPRRSNIYSRPVRGSSAGGGYSTAADLLRFALALRAGKLLGPLADEWFSGPQAYAGGAPGINAELDLDPIPGWTVVVLANFDPPSANSVAQKISAWLKRLK